MSQKLLVICGPTATGKTSLGLSLARIFSGEIISADSRQIYKGMNIVTGKDLPVGASRIKHQESKLEKEMGNNITIITYDFGGIPVWGLDLVKPDQEFSVAHFVEFASRVIEDIWRRGKLPIVVGGTGLYIKSLLEPIETRGIAPDRELREQLESWSVRKLQRKLRHLDVKRLMQMNQSDRHNSRRLIRAIEVALVPSAESKKQSPRIKNSLIMGLKAASFEKLYRRIDERVESRIQQGAEREARKLFQEYPEDNSILTLTLGYKQWRAYLKREITKEKAVKQWKFAEHAYARRQMTWFKKQPEIHWFEIGKKDFSQEVVKLIKEWYSKKNSRSKSHGKN